MFRPRRAWIDGRRSSLYANRHPRSLARTVGMCSLTPYDSAMSTSEAEIYIANLAPRVRATAKTVHTRLLAEGCESYVKTIYIGYDLDGEMVAALYAHADHLEVALALPEDAEGEILIDASHLTWRTLPVAAVIRSRQDLREARALLQEACERVRSSSHAVNRDNDFFKEARRRRSGDHL